MCGECNWKPKRTKTNLTLKNGLCIEIADMPEEKYKELTEMMESRSEEKIYLDSLGYFFIKDISKLARFEL